MTAKQMGKKGGAKRWKGRSKEAMRSHMRMMALTRWAKQKRKINTNGKRTR